MFRSAYVAEGRWAAIVLLAVAWICVAPRSSRATGCHVPDRPALDFTAQWLLEPSEMPELAPVASPPQGYSHRPCPSDTSDSSAPVTAPQTAVEGNPIDGDRPVGGRIPIDGSCPGSPSYVGARLDRPPREPARALAPRRFL